MTRNGNRRKAKNEKVLFTDIGDGGKDGKRNEVAEDAKDELVDPNIEGHFGYDMVPSVE